MDLPENIIKNDLWSLAEGKHNNLPLIIRFRNEISKNLNISHHSQLVQVFWAYPEHDSGMPSSGDSEQMKVFENRLVSALESDLSGILTAVVTTNGYREWVYYCSSVEAFSEKLHFMPQENDPYPIEIETEFDPEWNYYFNRVAPS